LSASARQSLRRRLTTRVSGRAPAEQIAAATAPGMFRAATLATQETLARF